MSLFAGQTCQHSVVQLLLLLHCVAATNSSLSTTRCCYDDVSAAILSNSSVQQTTELTTTTTTTVLQQPAQRATGTSSSVIVSVCVSVGVLCLLLIIVATVVCWRGFYSRCRDCYHGYRYQRQLSMSRHLWSSGRNVDDCVWTTPPGLGPNAGLFVPHTPVMWTPPLYDDLMAHDAAAAAAAAVTDSLGTGGGGGGAGGGESSVLPDVRAPAAFYPSPPPSYISDDMTSPQRQSVPATDSNLTAEQHRPRQATLRTLTPAACRSTLARPPVAITSPSPAGLPTAPALPVPAAPPATAAAPAAAAAAAAAAASLVPASFHSLDNIDLAIFGSVVHVTSPGDMSSSSLHMAARPRPTSRDRSYDPVESENAVEVLPVRLSVFSDCNHTDTQL